MPFMENGSLLAHLKEQRQNIELAPENTDPEEVVSAFYMFIINFSYTI